MSDKVRPWDMINGSPRASAELIKKRLNICSECPAFIPLTQTCKKCGCFMKMKIQLEKAYCPLGKW
jgi:hypothetical protein